ncbi:MAG: hypothetical protein HY917_01505 [Candidatus Diapherotrites archaeon]|nr:hypothetical protein [Candidatus Diapherotrites archaeon]
MTPKKHFRTRTVRIPPENIPLEIQSFQRLLPYLQKTNPFRKKAMALLEKNNPDPATWMELIEAFRKRMK